MDNTLSVDGTAAESREKKALAVKRTDYYLWGTYFLLIIVAVIELFSASIQVARHDNVFSPLIHHGQFLAAGLVIMLIMQWMHYRVIYKLIPLYVLVTGALMVAVLFGGASEINTAKRAVVIAGNQLLPADLFKLAVALGLVVILSSSQLKDKNDISWAGFWTAMLFLGGCTSLLFSHGLSNAIIVMAIGGSMFLVGGVGWKKLMLAIGLICVVAGAAYYYKTHQTVSAEVSAREQRRAALNYEDVDSLAGAGRGRTWNRRTSDHFRPNKHLELVTPEHAQENYSYMAQAHGGFTGVGIGRSRENARLPLAYCDYIYAIIIEELGAVVAIAILFVYLLLLGRAAKLTMSFKQTMPGLMVMGCAFVIVFQALYHMAIVTGVFPVSGQPLPLISKGGASVLATSMAFGVMLSAARHAVRNTDSSAQAKHERSLLPEQAVADNPAMMPPKEEPKETKNENED